MFKRLTLAALAAAIVAVFGFAGTAAPASADQDNHHVKYHAPGHPGHWNRPPNPYGANGYWSNGSWHNRTNPGRHIGWANHPKHPKHPKHHGDRDRG